MPTWLTFHWLTSSVAMPVLRNMACMSCTLDVSHRLTSKTVSFLSWSNMPLMLVALPVFQPDTSSSVRLVQ